MIPPYIRKTLPILFLFVCIASCTERIEISTDDAPTRLVIYGYLTTDTMQHDIRITRSAGYFHTESPEGISNATVTISTDDEFIRLRENDTVPGLYQTAPNVFGRSGKTYTLDVHLDFDNDGIPEHYRSSTYLTHINQIDSIALQKSIVFKKMVELLIYAQDLPEDNYYSIFVSINDSILNPTINKFFVLDDEYFNGAYMDGIACYYFDQEEEEEKLELGDKVTLNINAIPKEYATFISQVKRELRGTNPIFSGPPANVETNILCIDPPDGIEVSGFFSAYPSRYADTILQDDFQF
ncbi:MAG: DUF4249 domain-containing protein [Bacteroidales bacterium]|jgi:hypothetical protein|nr:DUF4249 domain-containing protein [Bacteroidales bacterium]